MYHTSPCFLHAARTCCNTRLLYIQHLCEKNWQNWATRHAHYQGMNAMKMRQESRGVGRQQRTLSAIVVQALASASGSATGGSSVGREAAGRASVSMDVMLDGQSVYWVMWYSSSGWWYRVVALVHWNGQAAHGLGRRSLPAALLAAKHAQQPFLLAGRSEACRLREWGAGHAFST